MASARIQPIGRKYNINTCYYDGFSVYPRNITERNIALETHNNQYCLIWKSRGISFHHAIKELKDNSEVVDSVISDKRVKSFVNFD